jgi:phosphopantothenoylcysteine decarboxylase/phosphopantothenate--cysteine ligase
MSKSKVLFIMTGSIACYKACQVISRLVQNGCEVQVVATSAALQFVGAATLEGLSGRPVESDVYAAGSVMGHIHLIRWADVILVAPATANYINKIAQGLGDDLATTLFLAHDFKKPFLIAPAMNTSMYEHPITARHMKELSAMGITLLDAASGTLACGESGQGKLLDPDLILAAVLSHLLSHLGERGGADGYDVGALAAAARSARPLRVLVTAGGTSEPLDGVRVLTNRSSGRTGSRLAELFCELGFEVTLLLAENAATSNATSSTSVASNFLARGLTLQTFTSFSSLRNEMTRLLREHEFDFVVHSAAVSDFSPSDIEINGTRHPAASLTLGKIPSAETLTLHFKSNPKIVDEIKFLSRNSHVKVVAFKLTSHASSAERDQAVQKLREHSRADLIVQNDTSEIDPQQNQHRFVIYQGEGAQIPVNGVTALGGELAQYMMQNSIPKTQRSQP